MNCDFATEWPNDNYELIEHRGAGLYGEVWKALQIDLNRHVAVKFLHPSADEKKIVDHAKALSRAAAHPNIVTVHELTNLRHPNSKRVERLL